MCDERTEADLDARAPGMTRRAFAAGSVAAAVALTLPRPAHAVEVVERDVTIVTPDGEADCHFVHPATGVAPAVLVWPDILGLRPAFRTMGRRLAESGYAVLTINPYYRSERSPVVGEGSSFSDPETRERVMPLARSLSAETVETDARAFVTWLDGQDAVDRARPIGTTGYCMGGPMVLRTAATLPERVGAGATFHGSRMVTDGADSPHHLIGQLRGRYLLAIAENDDERQPEAKTVLREAFEAAGVPAEIEVYAGAMHGWCAIDSRAYAEAQAERAHARLLALFEAALA
ncbi:MAG: dienelactone hydrolase family protein [Pseudomonadales bacterium]|jgi:carboxymethylenebutenolidase|nr:dienelactone hydrolase family protein [Pseudomonadales bacterium]